MPCCGLGRLKDFPRHHGNPAFIIPPPPGRREPALAILRAAAAAGVLLVLAPQQTRDALAAIFLGVEEARKAAPTKDDVAAAALRYCAGNAEACSRVVREAVQNGPKLKP
jgi:hypothetical protein